MHVKHYVFQDLCPLGDFPAAALRAAAKSGGIVYVANCFRSIEHEQSLPCRSVKSMRMSRSSIDTCHRSRQDLPAYGSNHQPTTYGIGTYTITGDTLEFRVTGRNNPADNSARVNGFTLDAFSGNLITASAGTGGIIDPPGGVEVASGTNKTFTITANDGYVIDQVRVDGVNNSGAVTSGSYTGNLGYGILNFE